MDERLRLAMSVTELKYVVSAEVTDTFFAAHPDWLARYGSRGRQLGIEDASHHLDFLAGAIESNSPEAFADYARWVVRVLRARDIDAAFVAENLDQIRVELGSRLAPDAAAVVHRFLAAGVGACGEPIRTGGELAPATRAAETCQLYLQAILHGDRTAALTIVHEAIREGLPVRELYREVFQRALYRIGELWEQNQITVAVEHMATAVTQFVIAQVYPHLHIPESTRGRAVLTGIQGELHQIGAQMVADMLEGDGWDVRFLGTNMPQRGILEAIADHDADVIGISSTMLFNVPAVVDLIYALRKDEKRVLSRIWVGGGAFRAAPTLYREIGADGYGSEIDDTVLLLRGW